MKFNSQKFTNADKSIKSGERLEQYFGDGNVFEQQKTSGGIKKNTNKQKREPKDPYKILGIARFLPISGKSGYLSLLILLALSFVFLFFFQAWGSLLMTIPLGVITFVFWKKIHFNNPNNLLHYLSNAMVTWKALMCQISIMDKLMAHSRSILFGSLVLLMIDKLLFTWFMPSGLISALNGVGLFGILLGLALCFGKKELSFIYQCLVIYSFTLMAEVFIYVFAMAYLSAFSVLTFLFIWTVTSYLKEWSQAMEEKEIKVSKADTEPESVDNSQ